MSEIRATQIREAAIIIADAISDLGAILDTISETSPQTVDTVTKQIADETALIIESYVSSHKLTMDERKCMLDVFSEHVK